MSRRTAVRVLCGIGGSALMAVALLAPQLGLDANSDWGPSRKLLLAFGAMTIAAGWMGELVPFLTTLLRSLAYGGLRQAGEALARSGVTRTYRRLAQAWDGFALAGWLRTFKEGSRRAWLKLLAGSRVLSLFLGTRRARVLTASWSAFFLVALSYLWFVSVGTWVRWPRTSAYQDMQAAAFLKGQTNLLVEPDPRLLALPDPYDPDARAAIPHIWDTSLFRGHYYLYWGPVPALLITPVKAIADLRVGDEVLVFFFSVGSLFWCTRLITRVWLDHFQEVPGWVVVGSILTVGWANPATWLLNSPWIYEAAIAGGQFFLLMGVNALYPSLAGGGGRAVDLLWAGACFSLAGGARSSLVAAAAAVTAIVLLRIWLRPRPQGRGLALALSAAFALPLVFGAVVLGAYNEVRFDSPLEFGHRYQLTSLNLQESEAGSTSIRNVPPNLYNYLVNPVRFLSVFPYIKPHWGGFRMSVLRIPVPPDYYSRQIAGLVLVTPYSLFALFAASRLWKQRRRRTKEPSVEGESRIQAQRVGWLTGALLGIAAAEFVVVQLYVVASMRYQADFVPCLMLASAVGLWETLAERIHRGRPVVGYTLLALALMSWTAVAGLLLGVTSYHARFEKVNPVLFDRLTRLFTP